jgi:hypothetical protein
MSNAYIGFAWELIWSVENGPIVHIFRSGDGSISYVAANKIVFAFVYLRGADRLVLDSTMNEPKVC